MKVNNFRRLQAYEKNDLSSLNIMAGCELFRHHGHNCHVEACDGKRGDGAASINQNQIAPASEILYKAGHNIETGEENNHFLLIHPLGQGNKRQASRNAHNRTQQEKNGHDLKASQIVLAIVIVERAAHNHGKQTNSVCNLHKEQWPVRDDALNSKLQAELFGVLRYDMLLDQLEGDQIHGRRKYRDDSSKRKIRAGTAGATESDKCERHNNTDNAGNCVGCCLG